MSMHACVSNIYIRRSIAIYFDHDWLPSLYHKMIYHLGKDIMVMGNGHPCIQYITYRIRTVAIYFNSYFHKLIWNNMQTILFPIKLVQTYSYWVMYLKYLYNKEYWYLLHLAILQLLHYKIIYQGGTDIMVWGCMNLCIQYITHRIRTVTIYFKS